uniref:AlkB homolog 4, lysine demethylase n=1 Tax=Crocodylus porosus TaxID=8502 RepID=A0A7M4EDV6_CROPO
GSQHTNHPPEILQIKTCASLDRPHVPAPFSLLQDGETFTYRPARGLAVGDPHTAAAGWAFPFPGVLLLEDFLSRAEEAELVRAMDQDPWKPSQSGRRKQDYGPKVNFKKQKLRAGCFVGLPSFSQDIVKRMKAHPILEGFLPVEQCNLDYLPERGSAIDPHLDDWWLWGERLVSLNLLSKTVLSMSCDSENSIQLFLVPCKEVTVAVHLPRRSLVVLYGAARYKWKHAIHRKHIEHRRVCITFRELSTEFSLGGKHENLGKELLDIALSFQGKPV